VTPATSTGTVTTSNADDFVFASYRFASDATPNAGSSWTAINASGGYYLSEYQITSAPQTGLVATASTTDENGGIVDAVQAATSSTSTATGALTVDAGSTLDLINTTITGGTLANAGTVDVTGDSTSTLNGVSYNNSGGTGTVTGSLALDGNAFASRPFVSTTSASVALTTKNANDVIVLEIVQNGSTVSSVSDTADLDWNLRAVAGSGSDTIYEYYAIAPNALSADAITVDFTGTASYVDLNAFGISGTNTSSPFDTSVPVNPATSTGTVTTTNADDLVFASYRFTYDATPSAGSSWTAINASGGYYLSEYEITSASQTGLVATASTTDENGGIVDAVQAASSGGTGVLTVDAGSTLDLNNTTITGGSLTNAGTVDQTGGTSALSGVAITNSETIEATSGTLTASGPVTNTGNLLANGGNLDFTGAVTGNGTATLNGANSILEFGAASAENTTFAGTDDILKLDNVSSFTGTVAGMAEGDGIDLTNFLFSNNPTVTGVTGTGAAGSTTNVTVHDGSLNATLELLNQYTNQFAVAPTAYSLVADNNTPNHGTTLQLATAHA